MVVLDQWLTLQIVDSLLFFICWGLGAPSLLVLSVYIYSVLYNNNNTSMWISIGLKLILTNFSTSLTKKCLGKQYYFQIFLFELLFFESAIKIMFQGISKQEQTRFNSMITGSIFLWFYQPPISPFCFACRESEK